jgi:hypothetical protein
MRHLGQMTVVDDADEIARCSQWIRLGLRGAQQVSRLVPDVFDAYTRVFHPAMRQADERDLPVRTPDETRTGAPAMACPDGSIWREVTWQEVAEANGRRIHAGMQWRDVSCPRSTPDEAASDVWDRPPQVGWLPLRLTEVLCEILAGFTTTPMRCLCGVWEGQSYMVGFRFDENLPRLEVDPGRRLIVGVGQLTAIPKAPLTDGWREPAQVSGRLEAARQYRSPDLWWPEDRAWFVVSDVDLDTTYVGGSAACIAAIISDRRLEALPTTADQPLAAAS